MFHHLLGLARSCRLALASTILLGWLGGLLVILQAWFLSRVVDSVFLGRQALVDVFPIFEILLVVILLRAVSVWGAELSANTVALHVKSDLRARLMKHLAALGPAFTQGEKAGELAAAAIEGVESLDAYFSQYLPQVVLAAFILLSILLLVFPLDPLTGAVFLLTAPLIPLFMYLIGRTAEALTKRQWETLGRLSAYLLDVLQGLTTLKLFGQSRKQAGSIQQASDRFRDVTLSVLRVTFLSALALELLSTLSTAIVAVEIGLRLLYAKMSFQQALFILVLAPDFYLPLRLLGQRFHAGMSGATAARRVFEILDTPVQRLQVDMPARYTLGRANVRTCNISFENVSFSYPSRHLAALSNISFEIRGGQATAIVGATGAGKSTLASLLLRFIEPSAGEIRVDGQLLSTISPENWRAQTAWVPQMPYLFNDTLAANLRLAKPDASDDELIRACQHADLHEFILSLPGGYGTRIGERGALTVGASIGMLATSAYLISAAALHPSIAELEVAIVGVRFFGISRGVFRYLERLASHNTTFRLLGHIRVWFYRAIEPLAPARLVGQRSGDLLARASADIETLENFYVRALAPPLVALVVIVGMSFFMRVFYPALATVLLAFLLLIGLGLALLTLGLGRAPGRTLVESCARLRADLVDGLQGLPDLLAYGGVEAHLNRVHFAETEFQRAQRKMAHITGLQSALNSLLTNLGVWLVLVLGILLVSAGKMDGVYLAVVVLAALASFEAVQGLPQASQFLESNLQAARRLFEIANAAPAVVDPPAPLLPPHDVALLVRDLCFAYPALTPFPSPNPSTLLTPACPVPSACTCGASTGRPGRGGTGVGRARGREVRDDGYILKNISFDLPVGKYLAIVGPSGAGKTTLLNLLLRFWDFNTGEIILGGNDIRQFLYRTNCG